MARWNQDPTFADVEKIAEKIEQALAKANVALHKLAQIPPGEALKKFAEVESSLLRFDVHTKKAFESALEDKRVQTLARGDLVMTCVLSAAVALSEFKKQPIVVQSPQKKARLLAKLQKHSTTTIGLLSFATLAFYTVIGSGVTQHAVKFKTQRFHRLTLVHRKKGRH